MAIKRLSPGKRLSGAVVHGNTVYLAGQVAADSSAGVKGQTEQILKKMEQYASLHSVDLLLILSICLSAALSGVYVSRQSTQRRLSWPTTARTVLAIKNGSMPISRSRGRQVAALLAVKDQKLR